jgi:hypothetical protein
LLDKVKNITLRGARIPPPPFYGQAKEMSGGKFPDLVHLASFTYIDVLVFHNEIAPCTLFHALVHATQMAVLGFEHYVDLYVRAFAKHRSWLAIPPGRADLQTRGAIRRELRGYFFRRG